MRRLVASALLRGSQAAARSPCLWAAASAPEANTGPALRQGLSSFTAAWRTAPCAASPLATENLLWRRHGSSGTAAAGAAAEGAEGRAAESVDEEAGARNRDAEPSHSQYRPIGRVEGPYTIQPKDIFAVVEVGPHQFKVTVDDLIYVEKLGELDVNDKARIIFLIQPTLG